MAAARCAAAVKYKKPYYFLALDTAWRGDDDGGCDEERRRPRSHSRSNFAFTNIECFAQVLARIYFPLQSSRLLKYFVLSLFNKLKHYLFFAKMINDLLQFTYLSISNDCCEICVLCSISWMPTHEVLDELNLLSYKLVPNTYYYLYALE